MLTHDCLELRVVEDQTIEARKWNWLSICDSDDGVARCRTRPHPPCARRSPTDNQAVTKILHVLGDDDVKDSSLPIVRYLAPVLHDRPESCAVAALTDEDSPEARRNRRESLRACGLVSRIREDFGIGRVGVDAAKTGVFVLAHVRMPDDQGMGYLDSRVEQDWSERQRH
jgi:hypothetical protein